VLKLLSTRLTHKSDVGGVQLNLADEPAVRAAFERIRGNVAPSPLPYYEGISQPPIEMTRADMDKVRDDFVRATRFGLQAGFDMLELHMAHGYLLASFLSPLTNRRTDEYGGSLQNRMRLPLAVLDLVRTTWDRPLLVRISASDWAAGGSDLDEAVAVAALLKAHGCDLVHAVMGQTIWESRPDYRRLFGVPASDRIRNEAGIPTLATGNITTADDVNTILAAGRADLCHLEFT